MGHLLVGCVDDILAQSAATSHADAEHQHSEQQNEDADREDEGERRHG